MCEHLATALLRCTYGKTTVLTDSKLHSLRNGTMAVQPRMPEFPAPLCPQGVCLARAYTVHAHPRLRKL